MGNHSNSSQSYMVESTSNELAEYKDLLERLLHASRAKITAKDIDYDVRILEREENFKNEKMDEKKIRKVLQEAEGEILVWYEDLSLERC